MRIKDYPAMPEFQAGIRRAPKRKFNLNKKQTALALKNALRYVDSSLHEKLAPEFLAELKQYGRIYAYRYRPSGRISAKSIYTYEGQSIDGRAIQVMLDNNLDFEIALYPYELVTYGETGSVCQNWLQYRLIKQYLEMLSDEQTLVISSGHPLGLFPSLKTSPRLIITNSLMVGAFDNYETWEYAEQIGVANYGQMTAGGLMYIGPQGIVHGTYNTLLTAARKVMGIGDDLGGKVFVSSGLGGMSGAQPKASDIAGAVGIFAEVDESRINTRYEQGWVQYKTNSLEEVKIRLEAAVQSKKAMSIAYHGNIIDLLEFLIEKEIKIDLLSDQTSCHAVYDGGYCPHTLTFEERTKALAAEDPSFKEQVDASLKKHYALIKELVDSGTYFFDYGNSFMKAVYDAGVKEIAKNKKDELDGFIYPSYVEDLMGPELFDYGFGPFRWVCLSGREHDLELTDSVAMELIDPKRSPQDRDNYQWIKDAKKNALVVGSKARILYQDAKGRERIALKFNQMVREGKIGPVMLGRDHHDTGGTDSPYRETANIKDGSNIMADMATQCFAGNSARGMTMVALHNGGGVGIGKSINGGFGLVLDGSKRVDETIKCSIPWDVIGGVARRAWAGNKNAASVISSYREEAGFTITEAAVADEEYLAKLVEGEI